MAQAKEKIVYVCSSCGAVFDKWSGKCRECGEWNTLEEEVQKPVIPSKAPHSRQTSSAFLIGEQKSLRLKDIPDGMTDGIRIKTGMHELDRALGGGIVKSSVILISGEPGIGKSTLLLQLAGSCCSSASDEDAPDGRRILYVSGEESAAQIKLRAKRLNVQNDTLFLFCETDADAILAEIDSVKPDILIIDSVQTIFDRSLSSSSGSISQVKQISQLFISRTKSCDMATVLVGHVNKDGAIAGPKLLEHMVDVVLHFEGDRTRSYRIVRAAKNRFGSTNEIGVFEMTGEGLEEVGDPSMRLIEDTPKNVPGACPVCVMEGTRPIIAEVQALVSKTPFPAPKRIGNGTDFTRMSIILAILEKRLGMRLYDKDVYINVTGGLRLDETSTDLGIAAAVISASRDKAVPADMIAIGELGLSGECRAVPGTEARVAEAVRMGFNKILLPQRSYEKMRSRSNEKLLCPVRSIFNLSEYIGND